MIRLEKELSDSNIRELNREFRDLIKTGKIYRTTALPEENDEPHLRDKPRITFSYNKKSAGRLNEMIQKINQMGKGLP